MPGSAGLTVINLKIKQQQQKSKILPLRKWKTFSIRPVLKSCSDMSLHTWIKTKIEYQNKVLAFSITLDKMLPPPCVTVWMVFSG